MIKKKKKNLMIHMKYFMLLALSCLIRLRHVLFELALPSPPLTSDGWQLTRSQMIKSGIIETWIWLIYFSKDSDLINEF